MSEFSDQLKAKTDLGQIIGETVALRPGGNGFVGLCPFHGEKTPSFHVHAAKQFFYCFGCHAHGDVYQFLMQSRQWTFPQAVEYLAERLGIPLPRSAEADSNPLREPLLRIHQAAREYFAAQLAGREGVEAKAYLQSRELPPGAAATFQLGYAPDSGRGLALWLERQKFGPELALRSGLCQMRRNQEEGGGGPVHAGRQAAWSDLYDRFRHRLMFPIADERGRTIAFGGRALGSDPTGRTPKYLNSPEHPLYTKGRVLYNLDRAKSAVQTLKYAILVEGYFDCIRVFAAGFENVVASCGTALTSAQIKPLARQAPTVLVNFDPDAAGAAAAERSIGLLLEEGLQTRVVVLDGGLDPDLYIRRQGAPAYAAALKQSRSFFDYLADRALKQFDVRRGEGKLAALRHLLPYLAHVHEPILRQNLAENLAMRLGVDQPLISKQLLQAVRERKPDLPASAQRAPDWLPAEEMLLRAWLDDESLRPGIAARVQEEGLLAGLGSEPVWEQLQAGGGGGDWQAMSEGLEAGDRQRLAAVMLRDLPEGSSAVELARQAVETLWERRASQAVRELQEQMQRAAGAGDRERLAELMRQKQGWDSRLRGMGRPETGTRGQAAGR